MSHVQETLALDLMESSVQLAHAEATLAQLWQDRPRTYNNDGSTTSAYEAWRVGHREITAYKYAVLTHCRYTERLLNLLP